MKVGSEYIWLERAIENDNREILQINVYKERKKHVCCGMFYIKICEKIWRTSGFNNGCTWYLLQDCKFLKIGSHLHSAFEKSIIERERYNISKIGRKVSMIIFLVEEINVNCNTYVQKWLNLFVCHQNKELIS
jgi:transposase-like protein